MTHIFIVNPHAGKGRYTQLLDIIKESCDSCSVDYEIHLTQRPGHATEIAEEMCARYPTVRLYACGGDGTLNEVCQGMENYPDAQLACVPCGSGNDFVRVYPEHNFSDIPDQIHGEPTRIDRIKVRLNGLDKVCVNALSIGFDAQVAINMNRFKNLPLVTGSAAYVLGILAGLFRMKSLPVTIEADGERIEETLLLSICGNGRYYGGGFEGAPRASMSDGLIDLVAIRKVSVLRFARLVSKYKNGEHRDTDHPDFADILIHRQAKSLSISSLQEFPLSLDGEGFYTKSVELEIEPCTVSLNLPALRTSSPERIRI